MGVQTDRRERISLIEAIATCARRRSTCATQAVAFARTHERAVCFRCARSLGVRSALRRGDTAGLRELDEFPDLGDEWLGHRRMRRRRLAFPHPGGRPGQGSTTGHRKWRTVMNSRRGMLNLWN